MEAAPFNVGDTITPASPFAAWTATVRAVNPSKRVIRCTDSTGQPFTLSFADAADWQPAT